MTLQVDVLLLSSESIPAFGNFGEDRNLAARMLQFGLGANLDQPLIRYRVRRSSACSNGKTILGGVLDRNVFVKRQLDPETNYLVRVGRAALIGKQYSTAKSFYAAAIKNSPWYWESYTGLLRAILRFDIKRFPHLSVTNNV